jgi:hypothetical protein
VPAFGPEKQPPPIAKGAAPGARLPLVMVALAI